MRYLRNLVWLFAAAALLAACHARIPLRPDQPRQFPGTTMQDLTFYSSALQRNMTYRVYEPADVAPGARLPLVLLLHGNGGDLRNWSNYSDVGQYAARGYLLVMADGGSSYYMNAAMRPADRYADYVTHDLLADVEQHFPVALDREHRAVVGVSMGGFAAAEYALARPELFGFAGAISPAIDVPARQFSWRRWGQSMRFRAIFGPDGGATRRAMDPYVLDKTADPARTPYIYLTAGDHEPLLEPIRRFAAQLKARGFAYEFHTKPGAHDWNQWDAQLPGCFESLFARMKASR